MTFQEEAGKLRCLAAQPQGIFRRLLLSKAARFRHSRAIKVDDAPEPSDLLYEHLEYNTMKWVAPRGTVIVRVYGIIVFQYPFLAQVAGAQVPDAGR